MSLKKRNAPVTSNDLLGLSGDDDDEHVRGSDSEEDIQDSRSRAHLSAAPKTKRRKLDFGFDSDSDGDESGDDDDGDESDGDDTRTALVHSRTKLLDSTGDSNSSKEISQLSTRDDDGDGTDELERKPKKKLSAKKIKQSAVAASKTGVVYISRIPPGMNIHDLRRLLAPYGTLGRVFLTPEDADARRRRKRSGGSSRACFLDGWIEFISKADAKRTVARLNTRIIGGKKRSPFHDDVWNLRYLTGFKWNHLTEQIANENAERAARLRADISQSTKENKRFVEGIEKAKVARGIEEKKREKGEAVVELAQKVGQQHFAQNRVYSKSSSGSDRKTSDGVLSKIF